jgi:hypothetical protein
MSDNLLFGNPTIDIAPLLKKETYLDTLLGELQSFAPPPNVNSTEELQSIINYTQLLSQNNNVLDRYLHYDTNFEEYISNSLTKVGIGETIDLIKEIKEDIKPLLVKVKFHYQRIRPRTLATYFNLPLFPYTSYSADTPSYPSGHAFQSKVYCMVLGNKYPKYWRPLQDLADDITKSRIYLGLHYESDCDFAYYMADSVLNHPDFKKKYKL